MLIKPPPLHKQVEDYVRSRIESGEFGPASRLPSTPEIAKMTGTSVFTVQTALARLAGEGLLLRKAKHATYVAGAKPVLTCAGLYFNRPFAQADSQFYQLLSQELRRRLKTRHVRARIWIDEREEGEQGEPLPSLKRAMAKREIQALIAPLIYGEDLDWLQAAPVATAILTTDMSVKNAVWENYRGMLEAGLSELKAQGCRSVGLITSVSPKNERPQSSDPDFYRAFVEFASELGLEIRDDWIRFPSMQDPHYSLIGYEQFKDVWNSSKRPDGVIVHPDGMAVGAVTAILEQRINVPEDLKLVFHANDMIPYICPFPVTFLQTKVGDYANALIKMVDDALAGKEISRVTVNTTVIREGTPFVSRKKTPTSNIPVPS